MNPASQQSAQPGKGHHNAPRSHKKNRNYPRQAHGPVDSPKPDNQQHAANAHAAGTGPQPEADFSKPTGQGHGVNADALRRAANGIPDAAPEAKAAEPSPTSVATDEQLTKLEEDRAAASEGDSKPDEPADETQPDDSDGKPLDTPNDDTGDPKPEQASGGDPEPAKAAEPAEDQKPDLAPEADASASEAYQLTPTEKALEDAIPSVFGPSRDAIAAIDDSERIAISFASALGMLWHRSKQLTELQGKVHEASKEANLSCGHKYIDTEVTELRRISFNAAKSLFEMTNGMATVDKKGNPLNDEDDCASLTTRQVRKIRGIIAGLEVQLRLMAGENFESPTA